MSAQISNPFTMNDWNIVDFLKAIFILQFVLWGVIALDSTALKIPMLRALFAFIYLMLVPGITLLRVFRLHRLGSVETVLYTVGLSVVTVMCTGLFLNIVGPVIGIAGPLSLIPLILALSVIVIILVALSYFRDRGFSDTDIIDLKDVPLSLLLILLVPLLSIYGTFAMDAYQSNILLMLLLLTIASAIIISVYKKKDVTNIYPWIVFSISLALLFSQSLISPYTSGYDIQVERYFATLVVQQSYWNTALVSDANAMLSVVMLAPIVSIISNLDLTWVFKVFYPLIYSLVPVGLYWLYKKQMDSTVAFLSVTFFMSLFSFYAFMPTLAKQQVGELFLVLILLLIVGSHIHKTKRSILLVIFCFGLIVSHYATSYIFIFSLVTVLIILSAAKLRNNPQRGRLLSKPKLAAKVSKLNLPTVDTDTAFTLTLTCLFVIAALAWYAYVAGASSFATFVGGFSKVAGSVSTELFAPQSSQGAAVLVGTPSSPLHAVDKYFYLVTEFFVVVGLVATLLKYSNASLRLRLNRELSAFNMPIFALLVAAIAVPYVAQSLQTGRLLHICLIFLAPLFVIGVVALSESVGKIITSRPIPYQKVLGYISIFLAIFLLFDSGFFFQVAQDRVNSIALNSTLDGPVFNNEEITSAKWLETFNKTQNKSISVDEYRWVLFLSIDPSRLSKIPPDLPSLAALPKGSYTYLGTINVQQNELYVITGRSAIKQYKYVNATPAMSNHSLIYANGGSKIYVS